MKKKSVDPRLHLKRVGQYCSNVSTTPITAMGCWQCLSLSVLQLKGKHCRKPHCRNGVVESTLNVDTFRPDVSLK